jgi:hypothetical protein
MSTFRNALVFFDELGVYDVVLPFLLIFSLMYAMLEKTRVFGMEGHGDHATTRKNLNAMVAFCTSFLVVASSQLVSVINDTIAKTMVLMVASVLFMVVVGTFSQDKELYLDGAWRKAFMGVSLAAILLILFYNLGWLQFIWMYSAQNLNGPVVGSFGLLIIVLAFMAYITGSSSGGGDHKSEHKGGH